MCVAVCVCASMHDSVPVFVVVYVSVHVHACWCACAWNQYFTVFERACVHALGQSWRSACLSALTYARAHSCIQPHACTHPRTSCNTSQVTVELSPYDLTRGRITYRFRAGELPGAAGQAQQAPPQ